MPSNKKLLQAAAGSAGGDPLYVEDVFSTYVYTGNETSRTIANGIALSDEGGLVWLKSRSNADNSYLFDTVNGPEKTLSSENSSAGTDYSDYWGFPSAGTNGFKLLAEPANYSGWTLASWTFRKAEKFFDIVTTTLSTGSGVYTAASTGTVNADGTLTIPHSLGSTPGCIMIKVYSGDTGLWNVYHRSATNNLILNETGAQANTYFSNVTDASFDLISTGFIGNNRSNLSFTIYLFAHDAGGYGDDGTENIISCGSFNSTALTNLGWEPQWVMMKRIDSTSGWFMMDNMRGMTASTNTTTYNGTSPYLYANSAQVETAATGLIAPAATGFGSGQSGTYIYIAIRRPMKTPEAGTEVFAPVGATTTAPLWKSSFPVDVGWYRHIIGTSASTYIGSRLTGTGRLQSSSSAAEATDSTFIWDYMNGWFNNSFNDTNYVGYNFKRGAGFMDVVAYTGNGTAGTTQAHNLTVVPELIIFKNRTGANDAWMTYSAPTGVGYYIYGPSGSAGVASGSIVNSTLPTASVITLSGQGWNVNNTNSTYIAYLFATSDVSKVGTYTGTGADLNVDCGFTGGARFILIKRTDTAGDWFTYDSFRGITAGNDPYLLLNTTAAQVTNTDYIDPLNAGFTVTSSAPAGLNASGGTYIFLAIA